LRPSANGTTAATGNGASGVYIFGAQLEVGSTATAYQRAVASSGLTWPAPTSYDITEAGQTDLHYLHFNGVSSFMVSPTITPGTDKAQVFVGVRKLSDAAAQVVIESSASLSSNNGTVLVAAPGSGGAGRLDWSSKGTVKADASVSGQPTPTTVVLTGIGDIAGDVSRLRINGTQVAETLTDQGTGNFLAYPIYTGRRAGTSLPFNGLVYCKIVRFGANLTADQIASTERWTAQRTGVVI